VIRGGETRVGVGRGLPPQQSDGPVAGTIGPKSALYYPLCVTWVGLGVSMVILSILSFLTSNELCLRLSAYSCLAFLLLAFGTLGASLWLGP